MRTRVSYLQRQKRVSIEYDIIITITFQKSVATRKRIINGKNKKIILGCNEDIVILNNRYIENLPNDVDEKDLEDVFKRYGLIQTNLDGTPKVRFSAMILLISRFVFTGMRMEI